MRRITRERVILTSVPAQPRRDTVAMGTVVPEPDDDAPDAELLVFAADAADSERLAALLAAPYAPPLDLAALPDFDELWPPPPPLPAPTWESAARAPEETAEARRRARWRWDVWAVVSGLAAMVLTLVTASLLTMGGVPAWWPR